MGSQYYGSLDGSRNVIARILLNIPAPICCSLWSNLLGGKNVEVIYLVLFVFTFVVPPATYYPVLLMIHNIFFLKVMFSKMSRDFNYTMTWWNKDSFRKWKVSIWKICFTLGFDLFEFLELVWFSKKSRSESLVLFIIHVLTFQSHYLFNLLYRKTSLIHKR